MKKFPQPMSYARLYRGPLVLAIMVAALPLLMRGQFEYLLPLAQLAGVYAIIVVGLTLLMGFTGQVSLGHAAFYGLGAYASAIAVSQFHLPMWLGLVLSIASGGLLAFITGFWILRLKGHYLALATLCIGIITHEIINSLSFAEGTAEIYGMPQMDPFGLLSRGGDLAGVYLVWFFAIIAVTWAVHLTESPAGRALKAVHGDEDAAESLGISAFGVKLKVFVASGILAAFAGFLYAFVCSGGSLTTEPLELKVSVTLVTMVVIGGMGSVWGGIAGVLVMLGLREAINTLGANVGIDTARYEELAFGLILVLIMIFSRDGLLPGIRRSFGRVTRLIGDRQ